MEPYPRIPDPPGQDAAEPRALYGARLFAFAIAHGAHALADDHLELAEYAGRRAAAARNMTPGYYTQVSATIHALIATVERRRILSAEPAQAAAQAPADRPNAGPMAPLMPPPIARPPAGDALQLITADHRGPRRQGDTIQF